jgi:hypothetical protein
MNNFEVEINSIIDKYIKALESYEKTFRMDLSKHLGVSESRLYLLPTDMYNVVGGLKNEYWMHHLFLQDDNKYAREYYDKTIKSFEAEGKILTDEANDGAVFEAMLIQALKDEQGLTLDQGGGSTLSHLKTKFDFEGMGYYKKHGDIVFTINGLKIPVLIDAKYSTNRAQIISQTGEYFNNIDELGGQIINEIQRGLSRSISYYGDDTWFKAYLKAIEEKGKDNLQSAKTHYAIGKKSPKILIYIFKDKGMWSSQVLIDLKDQVVKNALQIKKKNNSTYIGKAYNKDWLWYGSAK